MNILKKILTHKYALPVGIGAGFGMMMREDNNHQVKKLRNDIKISIRNGDPVSDENRGLLSGIEGAWGDLRLNEDVMEEAHLINDFLKGEFFLDENGKYRNKSLILKDQETPQDFILSSYPINEFKEADKGYHDNPFTKDLPRGDTLMPKDFRE